VNINIDIRKASIKFICKVLCDEQFLKDRFFAMTDVHLNRGYVIIKFM
jgi:hypothetical protein